MSIFSMLSITFALFYIHFKQKSYANGTAQDASMGFTFAPIVSGDNAIILDFTSFVNVCSKLFIKPLKKPRVYIAFYRVLRYNRVVIKELNVRTRCQLCA